MTTNDTRLHRPTHDGTGGRFCTDCGEDLRVLFMCPRAPVAACGCPLYLTQQNEHVDGFCSGDTLEQTHMEWVYDDGGIRTCTTMPPTEERGGTVRAVAIALGIDYATALDYLSVKLTHYRDRARNRSTKEKYSGTPFDGVPREVLRELMHDLDWVWVPIMRPGTGVTVHLRYDELPEEAHWGPVILALSKAETVVVRGVLHDIFDPSRDGTRAVYGYFAPRKTHEVVASMDSGT